MEILNFQDKRWLIKYKAKDDGFNVERINLTKEYRGAEMVLKKDGILYFIQEISELQFEDLSV